MFVIWKQLNHEILPKMTAQKVKTTKTVLTCCSRWAIFVYKILTVREQWGSRYMLRAIFLAFVDIIRPNLYIIRSFIFKIWMNVCSESYDLSWFRFGWLLHLIDFKSRVVSKTRNIFNSGNVFTTQLRKVWSFKAIFSFPLFTMETFLMWFPCKKEKKRKRKLIQITEWLFRVNKFSYLISSVIVSYWIRVICHWTALNFLA